MITEVTPKVQGDGTDSWIIRYLDNDGNPVKAPDIVYTDPAINQPVDVSNVDLSTLTDEQLNVLKERLDL